MSYFLSNPGYFGTNPQVGGSSPFQLLPAHNRSQTINPAAPITMRLPSVGIGAGDVFEWTNIHASNTVTVQSSNGASDIAYLINGTIRLQAMVDNPVALADWRVLHYTSQGSQTTSVAGVSMTYTWTRINKSVTLSVAGAGTLSSGPGALAVSFLIATMPINPTDNFEPLTASGLIMGSTHYPAYLAVWNAGGSVRIDLYRQDGGSFINGSSFTTGWPAQTGSNMMTISYVIP